MPHLYLSEANGLDSYIQIQPPHLLSFGHSPLSRNSRDTLLAAREAEKRSEARFFSVPRPNRTNRAEGLCYVR